MEEIKPQRETLGTEPVHTEMLSTEPVHSEMADKVTKHTEYLGIILKELEETKQELLDFKQQTRKKKRNWWKRAAIFEMLCLCLVFIVIGYQYISMVKERETVEISKVKEEEILPSPYAEKQSYRYVEKLEELVKQINEEKYSDVSVDSETLFGYEYLCFTLDSIKVYYRNEFEHDDFHDRYRVMIDNGTKLMELDWEYDLTGDIRNLRPLLGSFQETQGKQLLFLKFAAIEDVLPERITMLEESTLMEYEPFQVMDGLSSLFHASFSETLQQTNGTRDPKMTIEVLSASYTYAISKENYINAVYYEEPVLQFSKYAQLLHIGDDFSLYAPVYLSDEEFLGELTADIQLVNGSVVLQNVKYAAYVLPNQEDPGNDGVIFPRKTILEDRIAMDGRGNCKYLMPILEGVERNTRSWDNLVPEGDYLVYVEDGEKKSVMGIDVSKYQGRIDWTRVKEAGVEYAMIRLGFRGMNEGTLELDPYYIENIEGATKSGIPVGVYFFSQAVTVEEAVEEAQMVIEHVKKYKITYPIAFDTEVIHNYNARANTLTMENRTQIAIAFCEEIKAAGYTPILYSNTRWMIMGLDLTKLTAYDKWFAYFGTTITFPYEFQMLQYSDSGTVPGIEGKVDLNISFIPYDKESQ